MLARSPLLLERQSTRQAMRRARHSATRSIVNMSTATNQELLKKQAADKAVEYVRSGMVVGLGTGSTASYAVQRIGELMKNGKLKDIVGVPTSTRTYELAKSLNIPLATLDEQPKLDVAIDGADEVDPALDVIKGRGGALLRERVITNAFFDVTARTPSRWSKPPRINLSASSTKRSSFRSWASIRFRSKSSNSVIDIVRSVFWKPLEEIRHAELNSEWMETSPT